MTEDPDLRGSSRLQVILQSRWFQKGWEEEDLLADYEEAGGRTLRTGAVEQLAHGTAPNDREMDQRIQPQW